LTTAYFAFHGVAGEFWFATVEYNLTAYHELFLARASLFEARRYFMFDAQFGIGALLVAAAIAFPVTLGLFPRLSASEARQSLARLALGLVWFAADFGLVLATGHPYAHYVLMLFPSAAFAASELGAVNASGRRMPLFGLLMRGVGFGALLVMLYPLAASMPPQILAGARRAAWPAPTVDQQLALWIRPLVTPSDPVLNLGHYYGHMMYLGNPPAVRLLSTYHMKSNYGADRWAPDYLKVLTEASPKVVVISDMYWNPYVPSLGRFFRSPDQYRTQILAKVRQNYQQVGAQFEGRFLFVRKGLAAPAPAPLVSPATDPDALWF